MSIGLNKTKHRINSVKSTQKITKAMGMVATVKLGKFRQSFEADKTFTSKLESMISECFAHDTVTGSHYGKINEEAEGNLYLVITSNLGLCAAYNSNLFKFVDAILKDGDTVAPIGNKGLNHYRLDPKYTNVVTNYAELNLSLDPVQIQKQCLRMKNAFNNRKYKAVYVIYTKYINSLKFEPAIQQMLPVSIQPSEDPELEHNPPFFEPDARKMIHELLPMYLASELRSKLIEAQLSEQASRRTAMDNANDNADEIIAKLTIEFNKARQGAITQEITEVVSGANAQ